MNQLPVIRERRRFTDIMDEEIDDERKNRINQYGLGDSYTVRRLKHELGSRLDTHVEAEALIEASREGQVQLNFLLIHPLKVLTLNTCYNCYNKKYLKHIFKEISWYFFSHIAISKKCF